MRIGNAAIGVATVCVLSFVAYSAYANWRGESQAKMLCHSIHPGESATGARAKMQASSAVKKLLDYEPEHLSVEFQAAWVERYACTATISQGKVVQTSIFHDDQGANNSFKADGFAAA